MRKRINTGTIIAIAALLLAVLLLDIWFIFGQIRQHMKDAGISRLESISWELEKSISDAECLTMEIAIESREFLDDRDTLEKFLRDKKEEIAKDGTGAINIYAAGNDWSIIPDFVSPEDYVPQERVWYKGAVRSGGKVYLSSPYQDVVTGDICYTVSVMLGDGETVVGVDYTMDTIQRYVGQMYEKGSHHAVIVTDDGIIAGCSEESLIGEQLVTAVPEFTGIWALSKRSEGIVTVRIRSDFLYENLFASKSGSGWILIISLSDRELYQESNNQIILTVILLAALILTVVLAFFLAKKGRKREGEDALQRKEYHEERKNQESLGVNRQYRSRILAFMILVMLVSLYSIVSTAYRWGNARMQNEAKKYESNLSQWFDTQKSILDMFVSIISSNPDMLGDYEGMIRFLDGITGQFPQISVSYLTNPELEPMVYMNNGWIPDSSVDVTARPWYIGALESKTGWIMTTPYYDEQTHGYCVTIAEQVRDVKTGEFLGVFGIDFYMDKLVEILGNSYSSEGYAFLVDSEGYIINHPYGKYQMSQDSQTSVLELPYGKVNANGQDTRIIRDYDGSLKVLLAVVNEISRFSVYVVSDAMLIYGRVVLHGVICLAAFLICIILIYRLLSGMIAWQDEVNRRLEKAAQTDSMTGLFNKASAEEAISQAVKQGTGSLLIIDLDSFKLVNDLYSHKMGDRILIRFAELVQSVIRDSDIAGRIGGDEFALYCEGLTDEDTIRKKCEFLNSEIIRSAREYIGSEMGIPLGCSAGVVMVPHAGREYNVLFAKADLALHQTKKSGKHDVRVYNDQNPEQLKENGSDLTNLQMIFSERNPKKTAIVADRELFQDIYRFMVRLASVNDWNLHLVDFILQVKGKERPADCTDRFIELSANLLCRCDVILKYNDSRVIFLLMEPENRDLMIPVSRVLTAWEQENVPNVTISYQHEQVNM